MPRAGERIDNFTLAERLGANAFGEVWSARESITERLVRLNFLRSEEEYEIARFTRAISLLSRLNHPSIVAHTGHGFHRHRPYLATEHVQGPTIGSLMANGGRRMDELRTLQIAAQIADGLDHAWRTAEIIHRNLGPETILVDLSSIQEEHGDVRVKLIDFGHALGRRLVDTYDPQEVAEEAAFQQAAQQEVVGTPMTIAPEQINGARLTVGCDMYALGVTMHLLLTGAPPFTGSDEELRAAHLRAIPLDLQQVVPGLQTATATLVRRLMAKSPDGRFPDWASLRARLQPLIEVLERRRPPRPQPQSTTTVARKTATYERTPQGVAIPGGVAGGGAGAIAPPSRSRPREEQPDERLLFAALAERLRESTPVTDSPSAPVVSDAAVPTVDDGLSAAQRAAVWAFLFRNPAILEGSVSAPPAAGETPMHVPSLAPGREQNPTTRRATRGDDPREPTAAVPVVPPTPDPEPEAIEEPDDVATAPVFANLFTPPDPGAPPAPPVAEADIPRNPTQSPWWKQATEILRTAVIGRVRPDAAGKAGITRRITSRLRRLVASRDETLDEIGTLLDGGKFDDAEQLLEKLAANAAKAGQAGNDAPMCILRARMYALRGDFTNSLRWAQIAVQQRSPDPSALALVGYAHLASRRVQASIAIFDEASNVHQESPLGPLGQATVLLLAGLTQKAGSALDEADRREIHPASIRLAALLCRSVGDNRGEVANLQRLLTGTSADWEINERIQALGGSRAGQDDEDSNR